MLPSVLVTTTLGAFQPGSFNCQGETNLNGQTLASNPVTVHIESGSEDSETPQATWQWKNISIHLTTDMFRHSKNGEIVWHESQPGTDDERIVTRQMFIFDMDSRTYIIIQNEPLTLFSQGTCRPFTKSQPDSK